MEDFGLVFLQVDCFQGEVGKWEGGVGDLLTLVGARENLT